MDGVPDGSAHLEEAKMDSVRSPRIEPTTWRDQATLCSKRLWIEKVRSLGEYENSSCTPDGGSGRMSGLRISKSSTTNGCPSNNCTPASSAISTNAAAGKMTWFSTL